MARVAIKSSGSRNELPCYVKRHVIEMLKNFRRIDGRIEAMEEKANGSGLSIPAPIDEEYLATVGMRWIFGKALSLPEDAARMVKEAMNRPTITKSRAEDIFAVLMEYAQTDEDRAAFEQLATVFLGRVPHGSWVDYDGNGHNMHAELDGTGTKVMTHDRAMETAADEVKRLIAEKDAILRAFRHLKNYAPHLEKLLWSRYVEGKTIRAVCGTLNISESTQGDWHNKAIVEMAHLMGLTV